MHGFVIKYIKKQLVNSISDVIIVWKSRVC